MKSRWFVVFLLLCGVVQVSAVEEQYKKTDRGVQAEVNSVMVEVQFFSPSVVRIVKWPASGSFEKKSLSVVKDPESTPFTVKGSGGKVVLKTNALQVVLGLGDGSVQFLSAKGQKLLMEKESGATFTDFDDAGEKTLSVGQSFLLDKGEAIYGLGIIQRGKKVQRKMQKRIVQNNTEDFVPFFN